MFRLQGAGFIVVRIALLDAPYLLSHLWLYHIGRVQISIYFMEYSKYYEKDFDRSFNRFIGVLEILAILGTGIVIGYIVIAMYLPIFRMAGAVAG